MCKPFTHKSVRQLPLGQVEILNKDGGPNSADGRVLYVNVHLLAFSRLDFFKLPRNRHCTRGGRYGYHGICNFISRLRYISRFIIRTVTRFEFIFKRTLQRWRNVSTDRLYSMIIYLMTLKNTKVQKQYCLNRLLA